ncbi:MAG: hypothetical protein ACT4NU_09330 [Chromatiales bacterium]
MTTVNAFLTATPEQLINFFYSVASETQISPKQKIRRVAYKLGMRSAQVLCGTGFHPTIKKLPDVIAALGYRSYDELARDRNSAFIEDVYVRLTVEDILSIYEAVKTQYDTIDLMQYLLPRRVANIEKQIEATVNPLVIERYKKEMRAIYASGIAQIDFAESRLSNTVSGFRALINEVGIIVDARLIPVGDIFFRDNVLPEEKRKLLKRGLVPIEFVRSRLEDNTISDKERQVLEEYLRRYRG